MPYKNTKEQIIYDKKYYANNKIKILKRKKNIERPIGIK